MMVGIYQAPANSKLSLVTYDHQNHIPTYIFKTHQLSISWLTLY